MKNGLEQADLQAFGAFVEARFGLQVDDRHTDQLAEVLAERLVATGHRHAGPYLARLAEGWERELAALAGALTIPETYFFRQAEQFEALLAVALPDRLEARADERRLEILSAGCASGEEAYTMAMLLQERRPELSDWDVRLMGVDLNPVVIEKAREGLYSAWSLRATPEAFRKRYFKPEDKRFALDPAIKARVRFETRNLIAPDAELWQAGRYDVIFCRNVLIYLSPAATETLIAHFTRALAPGGYLFLGAAESLRGLTQRYHLRHTHGTFYYQLKGTEPREVQAEAVSLPPPERLPQLAPDDSWVEAIGRASERIGRLDAPAAAPAPRVVDPIARALECFREDRFEEALALLRALPPEGGRDPDATLLLAAVLTNMGQLAEAERVLEEVLAADDLSPGAHYLFALCREHAGDPEGARRHDEMAIYLDPRFAMPQLHLGLLAKRAGNRPAAKRAIGQALALLPGEDAGRILLFGGGFNRAALEALCRAELARLEAEA
ncbi:MAG: CheR family methyltransferase [Candidatus Sericytochromatia bacterium]